MSVFGIPLAPPSSPFPTLHYHVLCPHRSTFVDHIPVSLAFWLLTGENNPSEEAGATLGVLVFILLFPLDLLQPGCSLNQVPTANSIRQRNKGFYVSRLQYLPPPPFSCPVVPPAMWLHTALLLVVSLIPAHSSVNRSWVKHSSNYSLEVCHLFPLGTLIETWPQGSFPVSKIYIIVAKTFPYCQQ